MKGTWGEYMMYRLNFVLWRVRVVMQVLVVYFLWLALFSQRQEFFGYTQSMILTYVLLTSIARTFVLGTTTMEIGSIINQGDLSNFLIRPIDFFRYYIAKDTADKLLNFGFAFFEVALMIAIFRPPIFFQLNPAILGLTILAIFLGMIMYFSFSMIMSFLGFWTSDIWAPRFLIFVIMEFFTGSLFPLDILPASLFRLSQILPFSYFLYFPIKVYMGQLAAPLLVQGFTVSFLWLVLFWIGARVIWQRGLKNYTAQGR